MSGVPPVTRIIRPSVCWLTCSFASSFNRAGGPSSSAGGLQGPYRSSKPPRELSVEEQQELRRKINSRERKRMQDLNVAMDALREVMVPYSSPTAPPTGRRLSKISTLVLARNYILLLGSSLQEMRRVLGEVSIGMGQLLLSPPEQQMGAAKFPLLPQGTQEEPLAWGSGSMSESPVCQCGVCRTPRVVHVNPATPHTLSPASPSLIHSLVRCLSR
uniref:Oligodendrocyte transcription factor 1 n=1 Tax=Sinocyclocheilus grahami TaxID=75366 RepID=A0A672STY7_SINGR